MSYCIPLLPKDPLDPNERYDNTQTYGIYYAFKCCLGENQLIQCLRVKHIGGYSPIHHYHAGNPAEVLKSH